MWSVKVWPNTNSSTGDLAFDNNKNNDDGDDDDKSDDGDGDDDDNNYNGNNYDDYDDKDMLNDKWKIPYSSSLVVI
jgi:hypothetical protein